MDLAPNDRRRSVLRPLLIAAFAALAWLIWGAGTANAALPDPDLVPQLTQAGTTTLEEASAAVAPLPAPAELPSNTLLPVTDAVTGTVNTVTNTVTDAAIDTVGGTIPTVDAGLTEVVGVVESTVQSAVNPVLPVPVVTDVVELVDRVVDGAVGIVPGVVDGVVDILPPAPLPGTDVVPPVLPEPLPPAPDALLPGQEGPDGTRSSEAVASQPGPAAPEPNAVTTSPSQDGEPAGLVAGTGTGQALLAPPPLHTQAVMGESAGSAPVPEAPVPGERHLQAALAAGPGSSSAGSAGAGAPAWADVAAFWVLPLASRSGRMPSLQELPPVAPPFDPGSTPD